jgi:ferredoxin
LARSAGPSQLNGGPCFFGVDDPSAWADRVIEAAESCPQDAIAVDED